MVGMLRTSDASTQAADLDLPSAGRIVAQRGLFVGPSLLVPEDLYCRVERGAVSFSRSGMVTGQQAGLR